MKEEGDLWCVNNNSGAGWGEYPKADWTLMDAISDQCIDEFYGWRMENIRSKSKNY